MNRLCLSLLLLLLQLQAAFAQTASPPHSLDGLWQTGARDGSWGFVRFAPCGTHYCGTLVDGGGENVDPQFFGTVLIQDMLWDGAQYAGGTLLDVETGRIYHSRMQFRGADQLRVSGCVLGGVICGGQTWNRVE